MRSSVESLLKESYSLNRLENYKKAARVMHCKVVFILGLYPKSKHISETSVKIISSKSRGM